MDMRYNENIVKSLKAFGITRREAIVYLAGIELGDASIAEIAKHTEIPRPTLYPLLEHLAKEGLFRIVKEKRGSLYRALEPKKLTSLFAEKERALEYAIPTIEGLKNVELKKTGVVFHKGTDGFKRLWRGIFQSGITEYRLITNGISMLDYVKEPYLVNRLIEERKQRGIKSLQLIPRSRESEKIIKKDEEELRESRLLPKDFQIDTSIIIYGDEVAFVTSRMENTMLIVESADIAQAQRVLFDKLWEQAQK